MIAIFDIDGVLVDIDDMFENVRAVSKAYPNIVGLNFDKQKPKQNKKIMLI